MRRASNIPTPRTGISIRGNAYVWLEALDAPAIEERAARRSAENVVSATALGLAAVSVIGFGWLAYPARVDDVLASLFSPSAIGLVGSFALLLGAFVLRRVCEVAHRRQPMPRHERDDAEPSAVDGVPPGERRNVADWYHADAMRTVENAYQLAAKFGHASILPIHLLIASLSHGDVPVVFGRLGIKFDDVREPLNRRLLDLPVGPAPGLSLEAERALCQAFANAFRRGRASVSAIELFFEAYRGDAFVRELLYGLGVDEARVENVVEWVRITDALRERYEQFSHAATLKPTGPMNRAMTSVSTPSLDAVGEDLTAAAVEGRLPLLIGREREMDELMRVIEGGGRSVLLVGPEGVGKSSIVFGVAERMVRERVPKVLEDKRLVSIVPTAITAGVDATEAQARLLMALTDVSRARNVVLVIEDIDRLGQDLFQLMSDVISRRLAFVIATTTPQAYADVVEHSALSRVFERVGIAEPETNEAIRVVESKVGSIEYDQNVIFSYDAVEKSVLLTDRYVHSGFLPQKAIEACREAAQVAFQARGADAMVTGADVERVLGDKTGIPMAQAGSEERETLLALEEKIHARVIGQDEAVKAVAGALRRARAELRDQNRPISVLLFLGPSGTGKTALSKAVAAAYFGGENAMLRFDMSEYQDQSSVYRLIGAPGGEAGLLTEAVRRNPFSLILLDEFEKAHPNILNLFLQVFDEGRLTDASGRVADFTSAIVIVTSNAGTTYIQDATKQGIPADQIKTHLIEEELRGTYRPELLNRFDGVIVFRPLTEDDVQQVAYLMIAQVAERLEAKGVKFRATDEAVADLARKGYDPKFGARPLRRVVQEEVDNAIATALLEGRVGRRDTVVLHPGGRIEIEKADAL